MYLGSTDKDVVDGNVNELIYKTRISKGFNKGVY